MKGEPATSKPVGIWIRVSTEDQARGDSPEHHEARARDYAKFNGWTVREVYDLAGVSGKTVMDHPEAKRMLADLKRGHIQALIFSKLARLARNTRELLEFSDLFRQSGADMVSLQERIDTSTPAGRLFYTIIAAMAQWERDETADRVRASLPIRAKMGKSLGGPAPFGYQWKDKKLIPHPEEGPVRWLMYELFLQHGRKKAVVRLLDEAGYRTRRGGKFTPKTLERLIQDPTAKGIHRGNYTTRGGPNGWSLKPEETWVHTEVEALVTADVWERCNKMLGPALRDGRPKARKPVHLFAGIAECHCGEKMYVPANSPKYTCRKCRNKISIENLEGIYRDELQGYLMSPEAVTEHLRQSDSVVKEKEALLAVQTGELEKSRREIDRLYRLYQEGQLSSDEFGRFFRPAEERRKQIEEAIPKLRAEVDFCAIGAVSTEEIVAEAQSLSNFWGEMNAEERRDLVEAVTDKIVVGQGEIEIRLCYLPSGKDMSKWWRKGRDLNPR
jgi:site-specific DNA recombinase